MASRLRRILGALRSPASGESESSNTYGHRIDGLDDGGPTLLPEPMDPAADPQGAGEVGLSDAEIAHFKEHGYVVKRGLLAPETLQPFVEQLWQRVPAGCGVSAAEPATWIDAGARWESSLVGTPAWRPGRYHAHGGVCLNPPDENCGGKLWWDVTSEAYLRATSWHPSMLGVVEALVSAFVPGPRGSISR